MEKHYEEGHTLSIKFLKNGENIEKVIASIESIEIINTYDLIVACVDIDSKNVVFGLVRKSKNNEKIKNLSIDRIKDGEIVCNEYSEI